MCRSAPDVVTIARGDRGALFRTVDLSSTFTPGGSFMIATTVSPSRNETNRSPVAPVVLLRRRTIDRVLIAIGLLTALVCAVAGGLLTWGHNFANDYVQKELSSQNISFPAKDALSTEGRSDLTKYGGQKVDTGREAQAYASYINGHLEKVAAGATYADLGTPERAANADLSAATKANAPAAQIADLKAKADTITGQRNTLFKGETLRGLLLTAYAWSTMGTIAGIAAVVSFVTAALLALLVILGMVHYTRTPKSA
jgi:hypothetical protein